VYVTTINKNMHFFSLVQSTCVQIEVVI